MTSTPAAAPVTAPVAAPVADYVRIEDLYADPYPIYQRLRAESPVAWVPAVGRYMVTSFEACHRIEQDAQTFSADEEGSLMKRSMGHSMLRKDDPEHQVDRAAYGPVLRPKAIKETWTSVFEKNADRYIAEFKAQGPGADLHLGFAAPFAAENLRDIMGFRNATQEDMQRWSQTLIDGTGNYAEDPEVWARAAASSAQVDAAIDELIPALRAEPDATLLSAVVNAGLPLEAIRANMKMTIGGGLNEPRDVIGTAVWALLSHRDQLDQVLADPSLWAAAFEEAVRWVAPIGMYPRQTTREVEIGGVTLPAGARLGVNVGAANRDPAQFEDPEAYNLNREKRPHLAFGGGAHFCAGTWVARTSVAQVALPRLFEALPNLRLSERPAREGGWVFRGMLELPVDWD
ncbi:cytochrome P450 [Sinomonas cyclohexanicum]|uniref:Cytochrome P450 n=1 Tax=Sinomonas cyclohexanicum TaxID=322009 RepID=A0ABN6FF16_SINCY|nr:cytochrome P450 [Corynebacterium cyclohexanicum]BCT75351.1 cytochrome P450 [Corynebacterium cyclohexanicum]